MIGVIFQFGNELVEVRVNDEQVLFRTRQFGGAFATIDNLRLSKVGCIKEFPELKNNPEWRKITIERFKEKIKALKTEKEKINYIIDDLSKFGYVPYAMQEKGHRIKKL